MPTSQYGQIFRVDYNKEKNDVTFVKLYENEYPMWSGWSFEVMHTDSIQLIPAVPYYDWESPKNMYIKLDYNKIGADDFISEIYLSDAKESCGCIFENNFYGVETPLERVMF